MPLVLLARRAPLTEMAQLPSLDIFCGILPVLRIGMADAGGCTCTTSNMLPWSGHMRPNNSKPIQEYIIATASTIRSQTAGSSGFIRKYSRSGVTAPLHLFSSCGKRVGLGLALCRLTDTCSQMSIQTASEYLAKEVIIYGGIDGDWLLSNFDVTYLINYLYKNGPEPMEGCVS